MISEFHQLSEKITQLTELTERLRRENGALRGQVADAETERQAMRQRMAEAGARIEVLLEKIPEFEQDAETA
jgi:cell division protein ZapB